MNRKPDATACGVATMKRSSAMWSVRKAGRNTCTRPKFVCSPRSAAATFRILNNESAPPRRAFLGVRACELAAIAVQDRVLQGDQYRDPIYATRRAGIFIVAVNCTQAASTCFCTSMGTGPRVRRGYDLALTELLAPGRHEL